MYAAACTIFAAGLARAGEEPSSARELYDRGKRAYDAGRFGDAARDLARADELAPKAKVLDLAMAAARRADDAVLGMELVVRAESRGMSEAARDGRRFFASRVGLLAVSCPGSARCEARVDGAQVAHLSHWLPVGEHAVVLASDSSTEHFTVHIQGDTTTVVRPTRLVELPARPVASAAPSAAPPPLPAADTSAAPRGVFWASLATTGVLTTATVLSGVDTLGMRARFRDDPTDADLAARGSGAQTRTNVLLVGTLVIAAATAVVGYLVFRSHPETRDAR